MSFPQIGQTVYVNIRDSSEETGVATLKSRVSDIRDSIALIELPISENTGRTGLLDVGTACEIWYIAKDGSRYDFPSSVVGRELEPFPVLLLELPAAEKINRTQRRNFLRIETGVDIAIKMIDSVRSYHFVARTIDLSGGGLSFRCADSYRIGVGDQLHVWIALPGKTGQVQHAYAVLEVVRQVVEEERGYFQWISGKFIQISEVDRAKVVRACYERQLELRKKGIVE
ncbi:flagellar brake protein [Brevibacillus sp. TJ4]|uniref:flagellar brake protein n=1 Tax=Brevibacillus sp. TJ4 TaxID=3234853 RepID=UPI0037D0631C